jgi:ferredoxin/flavodoxin---NADP+ reductase
MTGVGEGRRVAIVGAGPSGFYTAEQLLAQGFEVDLLDLLPTPYGLVRAGVAPDHPKIKSVTRVYDKTAARDGFRFFGGIAVGEDVTRADLLARYHAVVYAVGTASDNRLGIPGEDRPGSYAATRFVAWYNGHPHARDEHFDLSATRAVVVGNGNVAIDIARMLVLDPDELATTDTADHALAALASAQVEEVILLGRRGPAQAAFTNPEVRELGEMAEADIDVDPAEMELDEVSRRWLDSDDADPTNRRNVEIFTEFSRREPEGKNKKIVMRFLRSPVEIQGEGKVERVVVARNELQRDDSGRIRAVDTGERETIECGMVLRSIGYKGIPIDGVPFDEGRGLIHNEGGRVHDGSGELVPGLYAVGWIKRGPSGVIGTNKKDALETVDKLFADLEAGKLPEPELAGDRSAIETLLAERKPDHVTLEGWRAIDAAEVEAGKPLGRPRVKFCRTAELVEASKAAKAAA